MQIAAVNLIDRMWDKSIRIRGDHRWVEPEAEIRLLRAMWRGPETSERVGRAAGI